MEKIEKIRYHYENNATVIEGTRTIYPDKTIRFDKKQTYCSICNIEGETNCSIQANCLNITLAEEHRANSIKKKLIESKIIVSRILGIGIIKTGMQIGETKFWHFKKGDWIRNQIMEEDGVLIQKGEESEFRYNSYYN